MAGVELSAFMQLPRVHVYRNYASPLNAIRKWIQICTHGPNSNRGIAELYATTQY